MLYEIFGHHCGPNVDPEPMWNTSTINSRAKYPRPDHPSMKREESAFTVEPFQNLFGRPILTPVQTRFWSRRDDNLPC